MATNGIEVPKVLHIFFLLQLDELQKMYGVEVVVSGKEDWSEHYWPRGGQEVMAMHPPTNEQCWHKAADINRYSFVDGVMGIKD